MPGTAKFSRLIPDLLDLWIVLDDNRILKECSGSCLCSVSIQSILGITSRATTVDGDVEVNAVLPSIRRKMNTTSMAIVAFAEDDSVEWFIEFNGDFHQIFLTLDIQMDNFGGVRSSEWPEFISP